MRLLKPLCTAKRCMVWRYETHIGDHFGQEPWHRVWRRISFPFLLQIPFLFSASVSHVLSFRIVFYFCLISQHLSSFTKRLQNKKIWKDGSSSKNTLSSYVGPTLEECELLSGPGSLPEGGTEIHGLSQGKPQALAGMYPALIQPPCCIDRHLVYFHLFIWHSFTIFLYYYCPVLMQCSIPHFQTGISQMSDLKWLIKYSEGIIYLPQ